MEKIIINGQKRLSGTARLHGAKNSALVLLAACLAVEGECRLTNCPNLSDVRSSVKILRYLGCGAVVEDGVAIVDASAADGFLIPESLMREMRSSITFLGAAAARFGKAELSLPGGCELGARPVDLHLSALSRMGAVIEEKGGYIHCSCPSGLHGAEIPLGFPSVGATENIMIAASTAKGETVIRNAAREPEISDLGDFLRACGADICGCGESTIVINGVERLTGCRHPVIPDRIEAATYMAAAAVTGGSVFISGAQREHLTSVMSVLEDMGCRFSCEKGGIRITAPDTLFPAGHVRTMPYPGFPTDAQAIIMAAACVAAGTSVFVENIFDNRFKHAGELRRLGANIKTEGRVAVVERCEGLFGAQVSAAELRGAAALVVAGLAAKGRTEIHGLCYLERGYDMLPEGLRALGADCRVVRDPERTTAANGVRRH